MNSKTPIVDEFINEIGHALVGRDGTKLKNILQIQHPLQGIYQNLRQELIAHFNVFNDEDLRAACGRLNPHTSTGEENPWTQLPDCIYTYLKLLRDMDTNKLPEVYDYLSSLVK